jgi:hypothetical protein
MFWHPSGVQLGNMPEGRGSMGKLNELGPRPCLRLRAIALALRAAVAMVCRRSAAGINPLLGDGQIALIGFHRQARQHGAFDRKSRGGEGW